MADPCPSAPIANGASAASCVNTVPAAAAASSSAAVATAHSTAARSHDAAAASAAAQVAPAAVMPRMAPRVLSIQSSVIYGYVGNKASNFPLQLLGFDVDPLHSCQLSNHTNYPSFSGYKTRADDVSKIWSGLLANRMLQQYTHLLTGYMTSVEFIEECVGKIEQLKRERPELLFVCDPVMGDNSKLYVPESFVSIYRERFLALADVLTPNQTEAERLTGIPIKDERSAVDTLQWFHARGIRTVVITSMSYPSADASADAAAPRLIHVLASTIESGDPKLSPRPSRYARMQFDYVPMYFSGTGDLTAALLLAWLTRLHEQETLGSSKNDVPAAAAGAPPCFSFATVVRALELSMSTLQSVIRRTFAAHSEELLLIQSKSDIEHPSCTHKAEIIDNADDAATVGVAATASGDSHAAAV